MNADAQQTNSSRPSGRLLPLKTTPFHDPSRCHKCQKGHFVHDLTDRDRRDLANELASQGFDLDYLAHKYGLTPRTEQLKRAVDGDN